MVKAGSKVIEYQKHYLLPMAEVPIPVCTQTFYHLCWSLILLFPLWQISNERLRGFSRSVRDIIDPAKRGSEGWREPRGMAPRGEAPWGHPERRTPSRAAEFEGINNIPNHWGLIRVNSLCSLNQKSCWSWTEWMTRRSRQAWCRSADRSLNSRNVAVFVRLSLSLSFICCHKITESTPRGRFDYSERQQWRRF